MSINSLITYIKTWLGLKPTTLPQKPSQEKLPLVETATKIDLEMNREEARKISLEKKPEPELGWNERLKFLRDMSNWSGLLWNLVPKSMATNRINHLLFVGNNSAHFDPYMFTKSANVYELMPGEPKKILSQKFFIEPKIPYDQQKNLVILVHGARTTGKFFENLVSDLLREGHPVIVGDMLGFGVNENHSLTNQNLVNDLIGMIEEAKLLRPGEHLSIVGHSLGAAVTIAALKEIFESENHSGHQNTFIDKLILVSAWDTLDNVLKEIITETSLNEEVQKIIDSQLGTNREHLEKLIAENLTDANKSVDDYLGIELNNYMNLTKVLELIQGQRRIGSFKFIHGERDPFVSEKRSKELHKLVKQYKLNSEYLLEKSGQHFDKKDTLPNTTIRTSLGQDSIARNTVPPIIAEMINTALKDSGDPLTNLKSRRIKPNHVKALLAQKKYEYHRSHLTNI